MKQHDKNGRSCHFRAAWLALALGIGGTAWADIHVAQVGPMTGPVTVEGRGANVGIKLAIEAANAQGGIGGQRLIFRTEDDEYTPEKTVALIQQLAATETLALLVPVGSPSMTKVLKDGILEKTGMPIVGVIPGAEPLRNPVNPYLYHIRAGDLDQYRRLVRNALTIGMKRIGVVYADIPFGKSGLAVVESMLKEGGLEPTVRTPISVKPGADYNEAFQALRGPKPDLIVLIAPGDPAGKFLRAYRQTGMNAQITSLDYGQAETLCGVASPDMARGVSLAQVFPNIQNTTIPLVRQFQKDFADYAPKDLKPSVLYFEGYVAAKVLLEAIKRIDGAPSREKLVKTLDSMKNVNLGGFMIDFSPTKHTGSSFVDIGVISKNCKVLF